MSFNKQFRNKDMLILKRISSILKNYDFKKMIYLNFIQKNHKYVIGIRSIDFMIYN